MMLLAYDKYLLPGQRSIRYGVEKRGMDRLINSSSVYGVPSAWSLDRVSHIILHIDTWDDPGLGLRLK